MNKTKTDPTTIFANGNARATLRKVKGKTVLTLDLVLQPNGTFPSGRTRLFRAGGQKGFVLTVGDRAYWMGSLLVGDLGKAKSSDPAPAGIFG